VSKLACITGSVFGRQVSADQFIEKIVVKGDTFAGAGAFDVLGEIDPGIARAADRAIPDSPHDLPELLLLPGAVAGIREPYDFLYEVVAMPISA